MCEALKDVTDDEWHEAKAQIAHTDRRVDKMSTQMARWAGALALLMVIIGIIGGVIARIGFNLSDTVSANKEFNARSEEKHKHVVATLEKLPSLFKEASKEREKLSDALEKTKEELSDELEDKTEGRYRLSDHNTYDVGLRSWIREGRQADKDHNQSERNRIIDRLNQVEKEITKLKEE